MALDVKFNTVNVWKLNDSSQAPKAANDPRYFQTFMVINLF